MEVDIEEDENEPELTCPYEEVDPLNPPPPASKSEPDDVIEVKNPIEHEDETVPASVYEVGESFTATIPLEDGDSLLPSFMRRDINSLFGQMVNFSRRLCGRETAHALVEKNEKSKDKFYGKLILDLGNKVCSSVEQGTTAMEKLVKKLGNTEDRVECKKLKKELEEARIMPRKSAPMTQAAIHRMIKESVDAAIAAEVEGAVELRKWFEKTESVFEISKCAEDKKVKFAAATLEGPTLTWWKTKVATMGLETVKEYDVVAYTQRFNELALMCPRMVEPERVKKSQAKDARILEGKKQKWENLQSGNSSGKGNQRDNSHQTLQNSQKQWNARAMVTAPTDGKIPLCERCFTRHVGQCTIKCHKCGKVRHKASKVILGTDVQRRLSKKKLDADNDRGRAYAIKDAEPQGPNVVTGTFLLINQYASILFDSGSDRSFVNTRFSSLLDIKPIKIEDSYEVELADRRIVSTNTVLKGCTLSLVNHVFEIDLMPIELGTFDVIIGMNWLVKHDAVIVCGEKVVRIPYRNKTLIVEGDKGVSR
ncbi:putative reverse transcriptase domain-containing protein [Tanacetum coccineum]